jgi:hypothetical protein
VLDKGIVTGVSLRLGDAPIALAGSGDRIVAESEDTPRQCARAAGAAHRRPPSDTPLA